MGGEHLGQSEVGEAGQDRAVVRGAEQHVGGLDVPVHDADGVGVGQPVEHAQEERRGPRPRRRLAHEGGRGAGVGELHGEEWSPVRGGAGVEDLHDVGVAERRGGVQLQGELAGEVAVVLGERDLEGDVAAVQLRPDPPHRGEATLAQRPGVGVAGRELDHREGAGVPTR